jgi:hypothetical protein
MTETKNKKQDGIRVDLLRQSQLTDMGRTEKIRYIIDRVREGRVVILENGLNPDEHALLIEKTMTEIDHDEFTGVDVESYPEMEKSSNGKRSILDRLFNRNKGDKSDLTVIGPASRMKTLHKDSDQISTLLKQ